MIRDPAELEVGQTVWLVPYTKTASAACHRRLEVKIEVDPKKHWPRLLVKWTEDDGGHYEMVFKDNVRTKPVTATAAKAEGDATRDNTGAQFAQVRKVRRVLKPIDLAEDQEQGTLF